MNKYHVTPHGLIEDLKGMLQVAELKMHSLITCYHGKKFRLSLPMNMLVPASWEKGQLKRSFSFLSMQSSLPAGSSPRSSWMENAWYAGTTDLNFNSTM